MNRSATFSRRRRIAGVVTAAVLSLGVLTACGGGSSDSGASNSSSSKSSSSQKNETGSKSKDKIGSKGELQPGDSLAAHNFALDIDGARAEYLQEVSGLSTDQETEQQQQVTPDGQPVRKLVPGQESGGTATVVRGQTRSAQFTEMINGNLQPATVTIALLDYQDNTVKQYAMQNPKVIKVDTPAGGGPETVTIQFTSLTIS